MKKEFPKYIQFQTNSTCNLECVMCPYKEVKEELKQGKMKRELFERIVDEANSNGVKEFIPFLMNDPFTDDRILDFLKYIQTKIFQPKILLSTNGLALNKAKSKRLSKLDIARITFHIPTINQEEFEKITGSSELDKVIENVLYYSNLKKEHPVKTEVVAPEGLTSEEDLKQSQKFWNKKGLSFHIYKINNRAGNLKTAEIGGEKTKDKIRGCSNHRPLNGIYILQDGKVVLCCQDWGREVILGNINENSISEIWNSKSYEKVRKKAYGFLDSKEDFICKRCMTSIKAKE